MTAQGAGRLFVVTFADDRDLRRSFGEARPTDPHFDHLRDAARVVVAGASKLVERGVLIDDRLAVLVDDALVEAGPLESRRQTHVDVLTSSDPLSLDENTILVGRSTWAAGIEGWRDGDLSRAQAIARISRDLLSFISHYTKAS